MINKQELVDKVTDAVRIPRKDVEAVVNEFLEQVIEQLTMDRKVNLTGFGAFEVRTRKGRRGVNPRSIGQKIEIPDVRVAKFRPGKTLKEAVK